MSKALRILAAAGLLLIIGVAPVKAQIKAICPNSPIPAGWVILDVAPLSGRCGSGQLSDMLRIADTSTRAIGTILRVCPVSPIPRGWSLIDKQACTSCCGVIGKSIERKVIRKNY